MGSIYSNLAIVCASIPAFKGIMVVQEERELQPGWGGEGVRGVRMGGLTTSLYVLEYTDEAVTICRCSHNKFDSKKANGHDVCTGIILGMVGVREENDRFTSKTSS